MHAVLRSPQFDKDMDDLWQKDPVRAQAVENKIVQIAAYPLHFKPLRGKMKGMRRVHFGSYVLIYRIEGDTIELITIDHHDFAYD
jgi:YafQ family addiction module toxin component